NLQQATVNLLADMGVQPATLQSGLLLATKSTDTTPPSSFITSPAAGSSIPTGVITIAGAAADSGGGVIGGVEVSADGGITWHPAVGRESWTYSFLFSGTGNIQILSRSVDDSGNIENPSPGIVVTVTSGSGSSVIKGALGQSIVG